MDHYKNQIKPNVNPPFEKGEYAHDWRCKTCQAEWDGDFFDNGEHYFYTECPKCDSTDIEYKEDQSKVWNNIK